MNDKAVLSLLFIYIIFRKKITLWPIGDSVRLLLFNPLSLQIFAYKLPLSARIIVLVTGLIYAICSFGFRAEGTPAVDRLHTAFRLQTLSPEIGLLFPQFPGICRRTFHKIAETAYLPVPDSCLQNPFPEIPDSAAHVPTAFFFLLQDICIAQNIRQCFQRVLLYPDTQKITVRKLCQPAEAVPFSVKAIFYTAVFLSLFPIIPLPLGRNAADLIVVIVQHIAGRKPHQRFCISVFQTEQLIRRIPGLLGNLQVFTHRISFD